MHRFIQEASERGLCAAENPETSAVYLHVLCRDFNSGFVLVKIRMVW